MQKIICGLNIKIYDDSERKEKVNQLTEYMSVRIRQTRDHNVWALKFFFCECLNFINVVVQIVLTDKLLGGEFSSYGFQVSITYSWGIKGFYKP